jgi:hypothetical protein
LLNIVLEIPGTAIRQEKGIQMALSLIGDNVILYIKYSKDCTKRLLKLINEFPTLMKCREGDLEFERLLWSTQRDLIKDKLN